MRIYRDLAKYNPPLCPKCSNYKTFSGSKVYHNTHKLNYDTKILTIYMSCSCGAEWKVIENYE